MAAEKGDAGFVQLSCYTDRVAIIDVWDILWRSVGEYSVGPCLGLGSEGDVVANHMVYLYDFSAFADSARLAGSQDSISSNHRFSSSAGDVVWGLIFTTSEWRIT